MKQFKTKEELDKYINENIPDPNENPENPFESALKVGFWDYQKRIAETLESEGYDLDDLVADGHAYDINGHTNNGWLYEDEADMEYIKSEGIQVEIRKR